jgi:glycosyltransferase involved in cell wall biosynthesis
MNGNNTAKKPLVSVMVPVYNSARTLHKCIESVVKQSYDNWEIIIVDSDSADKTREISLKWCRKFPTKCRYYNISKRFQADKRNFGVKVSRGDRIYLHDSDQYISAKVLEECVAVVGQGYDAVAVPVEFLFPKSYQARCIFHSIFFLSPESVDYPNFIKRDDWVRLGGLDEKISYVEDADFYERFKTAHLSMGQIDARSFHDQSYNFTSMILKTIYLIKGEQIFKRKSELAGTKLQRNTVKVNNLELAWKKLQTLPIYLPGITFAVLVRLVTRAVVRSLYR